MGAGAFKAETFQPQTHAKVTSQVTTLDPPGSVPFLDANDTELPKIVIDPAATDDLVTTLVKRELTLLQSKLDIVQGDIDRHMYGLREAQSRRAGLVAQTQKYASFLVRGES